MHSRSRSPTRARARRKRRGWCRRYGGRCEGGAELIARLDGTLIERDPPRLVVDCGGVGYDVIVSAYTLAGLPADGEHVTLRIYTAASENKIALYGFGDLQERQLFDLLITVKNVGP